MNDILWKTKKSNKKGLTKLYIKYWQTWQTSTGRILQSVELFKKKKVSVETGCNFATVAEIVHSRRERGEEKTKAFQLLLTPK